MSANNTARGIALGVASFNILSPRWAKYSQSNLNRRLTAGFEDVTFAAARVKQFV